MIIVITRYQSSWKSWKNCKIQPHTIFLAQYHITRSIIVKLKDYQWSSEDLLIGQDWSETNPCPIPNTILCLETSTRGDEADTAWFGLEKRPNNKMWFLNCPCQIHIHTKLHDLDETNTDFDCQIKVGYKKLKTLSMVFNPLVKQPIPKLQYQGLYGIQNFWPNIQTNILIVILDYSGGSVPSKISTWSKFCMTRTRHPGLVSMGPFCHMILHMC